MKTTKVTPHITETKESQTPNKLWPALYLWIQSGRKLFFMLLTWLGKQWTMTTPIWTLLLVAYFAFHGMFPSPTQPAMVQYNGVLPTVPSTNPEIPPPLLEEENDAAPLELASVEATNPQAYIERFAKVAKAEQAKYGIPASISLAQGIIESKSGKSTLAKRANNHFGMKCFSKKCKAGHCMNASDDHHKDFFRIFANPWESWRAHSQMLANGRYSRLKKYGRDYKKWAHGLKQLGYATDRTYDEKLIGVINRYKLYQYDK